MRPSTLFSCLLFFSCLFGIHAFAQPLQYQATRYHDAGSFATVLIPSADQGSLVAGHSAQGNQGFLDLVKYDELHARSWSLTYQLSDTLIQADAACSFGNDGYLIAASLQATASGPSELLLLRVDTAGQLLWTQHYAFGLSCRLAAILPTPDGGFIASGTVLTDSTAVFEDVLLLRGVSNGSVSWSASTGTSARETCSSLIRTSDDQYAIAGTIEDANGIRGCFLSKLDTSGNYFWFTRYETGTQDAAYALIQVNNGGYQLAGQGGPSGEDVLLLRTDANGSPAFARAYRLSFGTYDLIESAREMSGTPDGGFLIAGEVARPGTPNPWLFLVKFSANLVTEWFNSYAFSTSRDQRFGGMLLQADGGVMLAGSRRVSSSYPWNELMISTDAYGSSGCLETPLDEADSSLVPLALNLGPFTNPLTPVIRQSNLQLIAPAWTSDSACYTITGISMPEPLGITLYPQPATSSVSVSLTHSLKSQARFRILDLLGRPWQSGELNTVEAGIPLTALSGGLYQLTIEFPDGTMLSKRLLVQKP